MVVVRLIGGLGNQMFQYAAARGIAFRNSVPLKLDLSWIKKQTLRSYELAHFNIQAMVACQKELSDIHSNQAGRIAKLLHQVKRKLQKTSPWNIIREEYHNPFNEDVIRSSGNVYLDGYWQSEKYFQDVEAIIRKDFTLKESFKHTAWAQQICSTNAVSIHVRRGDYASHAATQKFIQPCSLHYYTEAITYLSNLVTNPHFFVFSDDLEWCKNNLSFNFPVSFVDEGRSHKPYKDLWLMSLCKHHLIANSTFSWWGAWLGMNTGKIVVAPQKWFYDDGIRNTRDFIPSSWKRL